MVVPHTDVDPGAIGFGALTKDDKRYSVTFDAPLLIKTPPLDVATPLTAEGDLMPYVKLEAPDDLARFFKDVEKAVMKACLEHRQDWFHGRLDDEELLAGFRSFLQPPAGIKVAVDQGVAVFDQAKVPVPVESVGPGTRARAVLSLDKITFGRTEFGALWTLVQLRKEGVPVCLIDDDDDIESDDDEITEDGEFM